MRRNLTDCLVVDVVFSWLFQVQPLVVVPMTSLDWGRGPEERRRTIILHFVILKLLVWRWLLLQLKLLALFQLLWFDCLCVKIKSVHSPDLTWTLLLFILLLLETWKTQTLLMLNNLMLKTMFKIMRRMFFVGTLAWTTTVAATSRSSSLLSAKQTNKQTVHICETRRPFLTTINKTSGSQTPGRPGVSLEEIQL